MADTMPLDGATKTFDRVAMAEDFRRRWFALNREEPTDAATDQYVSEWAANLTREGWSDRVPVPPTCEVATDFHAKPWTFCGAPTAYWYPTENGVQSLCEAHGRQHLPHARAISLTRAVPPATSQED